jgi:hypothetical protein
MWVLASDDSPVIIAAEAVVALIAVASFVFTLTQIRPAKEAAKTSKEAAEAAKEYAATSKESLDTERGQLAHDRESFSVSIRPLIVDTPVKTPTSNLKFAEMMKRFTSSSAPPGELNIYWFSDNDPTNDGLQMQVRNIANMPAFVHSAQLVIDGAPAPKGWASLDRKVIPPQETSIFKYQLPHFYTEKAVEQFRDAVLNGRCTLEIRCADLPGRQRILSRISVTHDPGYLLRVTKLEIFLCDGDWEPEPIPFATPDPA